VRVRTPDATRLRDLLAAEGASVRGVEPCLLEVHGLSAARIGDLAAREGSVLHEFAP
jgi:ABC-2 type transport system ATP-binding protein